MAPTCTICRHPRAREIDEALIAGKPSRAIAGRFGGSRAAIQRHSEHLPKRLVKAGQAREVTHATTLLGKLEELEAECRRLAAKAEDAGDLRTAVSALSTGVLRVLELLARIRGEVQTGFQVNVGIQLPPEQVRDDLVALLTRAVARNPGLLEEARQRAAELDDGRVR